MCELEIKIIAIECDRGHTHMLLNCLATLSPASIMQKIKVRSSRIIPEKFKELS